MLVEPIPSPNHSPRNGHAVQVLVLHATASEWDSALGWLRTPASRVSAHYLIGRDGRIAALVAESETAWHAGVSRWRGLEVWATAGGVRVPSVNPVSIGIELVNRNTGRDPYPPAQLDAVAALSREIVARHGIVRANVARHLDVSPGRKTDPAGFPWVQFLDAVYGPAPAPAPAPEPPAPAPMTHRLRWLSYVRATPATTGRILAKRDRGTEVRVLRQVAGELVSNAAGISNQWAELAGGGYIWLLQLEAL